MIHIILATKDRAEILRLTLAYIESRTKTPHVVTVIDDGSTDGTPDMLASLGVETVRRPSSLGIAANVRALRRLVRSDPFVFTDDDVLCPGVRPDWLERLLFAMRAAPRLGILALNNPQDLPTGTRRRVSVDGDVTLCRNVGATFAMIRHEVVRTVTVVDGLQSPFKQFCRSAGEKGYGVGYLTHTYCQHVGSMSVRRGVDMSRDLSAVAPVDGRSLRPPDGYIE